MGSASRVLDSSWNGIGYKVVAKVGQRFLSVWAGEGAEYALGVTAREEARTHHRGGLYVCLSLDAASRHRIPARRGGLFMAPRVVLRCKCEGPFVEYPGGKIACSAITPLEELALPYGYLHTAPGPAGRPSRPVPSRPLTPDTFGSRRPLTPDRFGSRRPPSAMRDETAALEAEVVELERRLGYR